MDNDFYVIGNLGGYYDADGHFIVCEEYETESAETEMESAETETESAETETESAETEMEFAETETESAETETESVESIDYTSQLESLIQIASDNQEILLKQYNALHGMTNVFVFSLILFLGGWIAIKIFLQLF